MSRIKVAVVGATGRMGRMIIESALKDSAVELVAAIDLPGSSLVGKPAGELVGMSCNVPVTDDVEAGIAKADCLIDFTRPEGTLSHLAMCRRLKVAMVVGTTGLGDEAKQKVAEAAQDIPKAGYRHHRPHGGAAHEPRRLVADPVSDVPYRRHPGI